MMVSGLRLAALCCGLAMTGGVAAQTVANADATVICEYSHTLADDPIVYPGRPGIAMTHDFLGNTTANALSTPETLRTEHGTTCENAADTTAYWAPALKLPDGTMVPPKYQKTYYTNEAIPSSRRVRVEPLPAGLRMLAGDHNGALPNPRISFLCTGRGYTNTIPTNCVPDPEKGTQFNIGIYFPTCWDGRNLAPVKGVIENVVYPDKQGVCPTTHPIHIPEVNFNLAYRIGQVTDLTEARLSMDPTLDALGRVVAQNWGTLYTAHADFFNGWREESLRYMADYCLNAGRLCNKQVPYAYSEPLGDATVRGGDTADKNYGNDLSLYAHRPGGTATEAMIYMKFRIPQGAVNVPARFTPDYQLRVYGGNTTDKTAAIIRLYRVSTDWTEDTITANNAPPCQGTMTDMYLDNAIQYRTFKVSKAINEAIAEGKDTIAFCLRGNGDRIYEFGSRDADNPPLQLMMTLNPLNY
ncbi:DUF1996 domain-containing protein [Cupriavidus pauculus]|uniref:Uncharacterized protein n=1 Tax=Cupriavidus pauculus TaxID=82633 RepID=A0A2N5C776_9BURK|nr:DUF1996 domain-containing protein [Cupriavidus pauculus]PLP98058.1 hypothetical protein CYJ10_23275 [Cupriavidus pauculus]